MKGDSIKGLSFENFRIFKDESVFDFAPLTILTGANSSGKSTVIKGLKLFKTFEQDRNEDWTLHFEEGTHQLGDFEIILSDASGKQEIKVCYKIAHESSADPLGATALRVENIFEPDDSNSMKNGRLKRSSVYSEAEAGPVLLYRAERTCSHCRYYLNKAYLLRHAPSPERLDEYFPAPEILKLIARIPLDAYKDFEKQLWTLILQTYPEWQERLSLADFLEGLDELDRLVATSPLRLEGECVSLDSLKRFIKEGASSADFPSFYEELISKVVAETSHYEASPAEANPWYEIGYPPSESEAYPQESNLKALLLYLHYLEYNLFEPVRGEYLLKIRLAEAKENICTYLERLAKRLEALSYEEIQSFYSQVFFIESIRANTQRLYTYFSQGTSFNEFLLKFMRNEYPDKERSFLSKWIKAFEIGDDIDFRIVRGVGSQIFILRGDKRINVVDLGYGVTQFLPVLLHIVYNIHKTSGGITIAVQEPETNLHPRLQSKLADLFIDAQKTFGIQFIIETHSEYLIRKLQYLTAKGDIRPEDTVIHYLDHADPARRDSAADPQIRKIQILPDGRLSKPFGKGFFDEADNLALELMPYSLK